MATDNAANRLLKILTIARAQPANLSTLTAWSVAIGVDEKNKPEFFRRFGLLLMLCSRVRSEIESVTTGTTELYLERFPEIEKALYLMPLQNPWQNTKNEISDTAMYGLKHCAQKLSEVAPEPDIEEAKLSEVHVQLSQLLESVPSLEDVDDDFKRFLVDQLTRLIKSIADYKVGGFRAVQETLETVFGASALRPEIRKAIRETSTGGTFWKILQNVSLIVSLAANACTIRSFENDAIPPIDRLPATLHQTPPQLPSLQQPISR